MSTWTHPLKQKSQKLSKHFVASWSSKFARGNQFFSMFICTIKSITCMATSGISCGKNSLSHRPYQARNSSLRNVLPFRSQCVSEVLDVVDLRIGIRPTSQFIPKMFNWTQSHENRGHCITLDWCCAWNWLHARATCARALPCWNVCRFGFLWKKGTTMPRRMSWRQVYAFTLPLKLCSWVLFRLLSKSCHP